MEGRGGLTVPLTRPALTQSGSECPVTLERFKVSGPDEPTVLSQCGHTISRSALERILKTDARCPLCRKVGSRDASTYLPNLRLRSTLQRLPTHRERRKLASAGLASSCSSASSPSFKDFPEQHDDEAVDSDATGSVAELEASYGACSDALVEQFFKQDACVDLTGHEMRLLDVVRDSKHRATRAGAGSSEVVLIGRSKQVHDGKIVLGPGQSIVLCGAITFDRITFEGLDGADGSDVGSVPRAQIVCAGRTSHITLAQCHVVNCEVNVVGGSKLLARDCRMLGNSCNGVLVSGNETLATLMRCRLEGNAEAAVRVHGAATAVLRQCQMRSSKGGLLVFGFASSADAVGCKFADNSEYGVLARRGAAVTLNGCSIEGTRAGFGLIAEAHTTVAIASACELNGNARSGAHATDGATVRLMRCDLDANTGNGLLVVGCGSRAVAKHCKFTHNRRFGIALNKGGSVCLEHCATVGSRTRSGLHAQGPGCTATAVACQLHGNAGMGAYALNGATLQLAKCELTENKVAGLFVSGADARAAATECSVARNQCSGVLITGGAAVTLQTCVLIGNSISGLYAQGAATEATATACELEENGGTGAEVRDGAMLQLARCNVRANKADGMHVTGDSTQALATECGFRSNREHGVLVTGGSVDLQASSLLGSGTGYGLSASGPDTKVTMTECVTRGNRKGSSQICSGAQAKISKTTKSRLLGVFRL